MTVQVEYGDTFNDNGWLNVEDFFGDATEFFNDTDYNENVGEFAGEENSDPLVDISWLFSWMGTFSGTQYVLEGGNNGESFGMIIEAADGEYLDYTFFQGPATHTLYGEIGSITFGRDLVEAADGTFSFAEELISFEGLETIGLNAGVDANGNLIDRDAGNNDTHNIVNGLMNSDFNGLIEALTDLDHGGLVLGDEVPPVGIAAVDNLDVQLAA
jgi:heme acquisition protein HasA